jgi:Tfp pilus assembly protein PilO
MVQLDFRQKFYFTIGFLSLLFSLLLFGVVFPRFREIERAFESLRAAKQERSSLELQLASLREFATRLDELDNEFQKIREDVFVDSKAPIEFVQFLESMAANTGLDIKIISATQTRGKVFEKALLFDIEITGSASGAFRFLAKLEKASYFVEIKGFQLQGSQEQKGGITYPSGSVFGRVSLLAYAR